VTARLAAAASGFPGPARQTAITAFVGDEEAADDMLAGDFLIFQIGQFFQIRVWSGAASHLSNLCHRSGGVAVQTT